MDIVQRAFWNSRWDFANDSDKSTVRVTRNAKQMEMFYKLQLFAQLQFDAADGKHLQEKY